MRTKPKLDFYILRRTILQSLDKPILGTLLIFKISTILIKMETGHVNTKGQNNNQGITHSPCEACRAHNLCVPTQNACKFERNSHAAE